MKGAQSLRQEQALKLQQRLNMHNVMLGRMLEMSAPEFDDEIRRRLDDNPALEAANDDTGTHAEAESPFAETAEQLQMADYGDPDDMPAYLGATQRADSSFDPIAATADDTAGQYGILMRRLAAESELSPYELRVAAYIVGNLDSNGYLTRPLIDIADDIAVADGIDVDLDMMKRVHAAVRALDPAGIGAFDLSDCLLLQLERKEPTPQRDMAIDIVRNHFDLFSKKHYDRLASAIKADPATMAAAIDMILSLNPRPGASLGEGASATRARHVTPDFVLECDDDGTMRVSTADSGIRPVVSKSFDVPKEGSAAALTDAAAFVRRKREEATNFIRLFELRAETLTLIAGTIVAIQHDFFATGDPSEIKPMILKDVQARTGLDMSVISRAVSGKYILTPHGVYPLKYFFNEHPRQADAPGSHTIIEAIRALIEGENKKAPLSDRAIMESLEAQGFDTARRTVAKYRERLGYPVARLRKTYRTNE